MKVGTRCAGRAVRVVALAVPAAVRTALTRRGRRERRGAEELARVLERLGGAFLKAGQFLGARPDLVGETVADALGRLQDDVAPMTARQAVRAVRAGLPGAPPELAAACAAPPVASGSIACVYRAWVGGRAVAVKVRRPGVGDALAADMALLRGAAAAAGRLPFLRRVPLAEIAARVAQALTGQLDFAAEAANLRRLRADLADVPGVVVPDVVPELCGDGVITMEFVEGLDRGAECALTRGERREAVTRLVRAVYRMLFVTGRVHADLHQGNVYLVRGGGVVLLDAGFVVALSASARRRFTEFFGGMIRGDGELCARALLASVRRVEPGADLGAFRRRVADLVERAEGRTAAEFDLPAFCLELFDLQRRYRLFAEPEFVFPMLCLLAAEGAVRRHHPTLDFQMEAAPYAMQGLLLSGDA
ncbi:AarF/UbiB family protein [Actinomadura sp. NPDC047616]|uniref:ABC1 kinase family protein n=1 Tax=Actinomadura sp. NPDC047616 TaxID=3155914 RepID=UPI0033E9EB17